MSEFIGSPSCAIHSFYAALVESTDIDIKPTANSRDVFHILRLIRHDRTSPACEQHVCNIIYSYIVCDIMDQRHVLSYVFHIFSKHFRPPKNKKADMPIGHICLMTCSYKTAVYIPTLALPKSGYGSGTYTSRSQPACTSSPFSILQYPK